MKRDDKSFMEVERVSWGWNSSVLFSKYGCIGNRVMKSPLRLALLPPFLPFSTLYPIGRKLFLPPLQVPLVIYSYNAILISTGWSPDMISNQEPFDWSKHARSYDLDLTASLGQQHVHIIYVRFAEIWFILMFMLICHERKILLIRWSSSSEQGTSFIDRLHILQVYFRLEREEKLIGSIFAGEVEAGWNSAHQRVVRTMSRSCAMST
jgi:hypothetical protein